MYKQQIQNGLNIKASHSAILVLLFAVLSGCNTDTKTEHPAATEDSQKIRPVKLITVGDMAHKNIQHFPATLSANKEVAISFQVPGKLVKFDVKPGDEVSKGDLLASVDDRDFTSQLDMSAADHRLAQVQFNRINNLYKKKLISQAEYDSASAQLKATGAALRLAKDKVSDSHVYAPFSGQIAATFVENHQYIQPQQTLLLLQDTDILNVVIQVPANTLHAIQYENVNLDYRPTVSIGTGETARSFPITYKQHSTQASPGTQSYEIVYTMDNPEDMTLYAGMGATVSIDFNQALKKTDAKLSYLVPLSAVMPNDATGLHEVWIYDQTNSTVSPRQVEVGEIMGNSIQISGDITATDVIAATGLSNLTTGTQVKPLTRERGL